MEFPLKKSSKEDRFMVYLSTFVTVCGSYALGSCAGYSSPTQAGIRQDVNLSIAEYSLFGSILTFGAMIGAITSGKIADSIGQKKLTKMFSLDGKIELQVDVELPTYGYASVINIQISCSSDSLLLHWGAQKSQNVKWILPRHRLVGTIVYKDRALRSRFVKV